MSSASNLALAMKVVAAAFMFALPVFLWVIKFGWEWQPAQFEDQLMIWVSIAIQIFSTAFLCQSPQLYFFSGAWRGGIYCGLRCIYLCFWISHVLICVQTNCTARRYYMYLVVRLRSPRDPAHHRIRRP